MLNKIDQLRKQLESIKTEMDKLSGFRNTPFVRKFRRQLEGESSAIKAKIAKLAQTST